MTSVFEKMRDRPYAEAVKPPASPAPPWSFDPEAAQSLFDMAAKAGRVALTSPRVTADVAKDVPVQAAAGAAEGLEIAGRKVGGVLNDFAASVPVGPLGTPAGLPTPEQGPFPDMRGGRTVESLAPEPQTAVGGLTRGLASFLMLYGPASAALGGTTFAGALAAGALADIMAFENKKGTISDLLREYVADNAATQFLSGELSENEWEASLKAGLEGAALGVAYPAIRGLMRAVKANPEMGKVLIDRLMQPGPAAGSPGAQKGMVAYHGSPHKFDAFDMSKVGTGEGAQAYGYGLYFAENPGVAKGYSKSTSYADTVRQFRKDLPDDAGFDELMEMADAGEFPEKMTEVLRALQEDDWLGFDYPAQAVSAAFLEAKNFDISPRLRQAIDNYGSLYTVDIPDDQIAKMLDWDKPLSEQPELQEVFSNLGVKVTDDMTGGEAYKALSEGLQPPEIMDNPGYPYGWGGVQRGDEGQKYATAELAKAGIPGIRYLDQGSRAAGEGTRNLVLFDEKLATIIERDGKKVETKPATAPAAPSNPLAPAAALTPEEQLFASGRQLMRDLDAGGGKGSQFLSKPPEDEVGKALVAALDESIASGGGVNLKSKTSVLQALEQYNARNPIMVDGKKATKASLGRWLREQQDTGNLTLPKDPGPNEIIEGIVKRHAEVQPVRSEIMRGVYGDKPPLGGNPRPIGAVTFSSLTDAVSNVGRYVGTADPVKRAQAVSSARTLLDQNYSVKSLLKQNAKLEKSGVIDPATGEKLPLTLADGRPVTTYGLSFSPAYEEDALKLCANSASCKDSCLGLTSGGNRAYGGGADLKAIKGSRLAHFNMTQAFLRDPEAFMLALDDEVGKMAAKAAADGAQLGIRLNTLSDVPPKVYADLFRRYPDVIFYDYTKLDSKAIAPNHHLTYSSTGVSDPARGVVNPHSNWSRMRSRMDGGDNVAMSFTVSAKRGEPLPKFVVDAETGKRYRVVDGDTHDFRPADKVPAGEDGVIIGLRNKDDGTLSMSREGIVEHSKGFTVFFDPAKGDVAEIAVQQKRGKAGDISKTTLPAAFFFAQFPHAEDYTDLYGEDD
jgi:hypothetical protein